MGERIRCPRDVRSAVTTVYYDLSQPRSLTLRQHTARASSPNLFRFFDGDDSADRLTLIHVTRIKS
jgi:hypothetical protein